MAQAFNTVAGLLSIVMLVCWIIVLVTMFQRGRIAPAVASLVLILCGIGPLVALVYGWLHADELQLRKVMLVWTVCLVMSVMAACAGLVPGQIGI